MVAEETGGLTFRPLTTIFTLFLCFVGSFNVTLIPLLGKLVLSLVNYLTLSLVCNSKYLNI